MLIEVQSGEYLGEDDIVRFADQYGQGRHNESLTYYGQRGATEDFIYGSVKREFQSRYRNSLLGALWNIINPLAMIIVYTVIFSQLMRARLPGVENNLPTGSSSVRGY